MKRFIVTAHGWCASNWTAHALNLNKHIICTHSARNELATDKNLQSNKNLKKNINQLQKGYLLRQARSLDDIYEDIETKGVADSYGSVHVLRLRDLPIINAKFGPSKRSFNVVNMVRNPIDLVWSGYGQFKDLFRYDINELYWTTGKVVNQALDFANYISNKYSLFLGDIENLSFIGACAVLESLKFDLDSYCKIESIDNINFKGTVKMEDLTLKKEIFSSFMNSLGLREFNNEKYLEEVFNTGIVNKHKHDKLILSPEERFNQFLPWQKEVFIYFFQLHELRDKYAEFGYNFEFVPYV